MKYVGPLYARMGGKYVKLREDSNYVDGLERENAKLKAAAKCDKCGLHKAVEYVCTTVLCSDRQKRRAELEELEELIEQMRVELQGFVDILRILTRNSGKAPANEFTIAMITCIGRNELIIEAALSAAERGE